MVSPQLRSRSYRRVKVRTPTGVKTHYIRKGPSRASCPVTGEKLPGVSSKGPKSAKRPSRPFGGMLSSRAMRMYYRTLARAEQ